MSQLIQPRLLKGFRDYPPALMIPREQLLDQARRVFRGYGFAPIDTPALEYAEILLGKGGEESDKITYRFKDHGGRDVALRFDLTVPFARFAAQNISELGVPFKRYAMGPVWRGENTGHGRFREFWQCDFDIIGTTSNVADIEVVLVIHDLMQALGFKGFQIHINNRLVLNGFLEEMGILSKATRLLRALDKLAKVGRESVVREMVGATPTQADGLIALLRPDVTDEEIRAFLDDSGLSHLQSQVRSLLDTRGLFALCSEAEQAGIREDLIGVTPEQANRVLDLTGTAGANEEILDRLQRDFGTNVQAADGIARLKQLLTVAKAAGVPEKQLRLDLSIARGLDYYTGIIYETFLDDLPAIGSVCSGGRYDNLAGLYTRQQLPGVGASLGVDRLLAAMEELNLLPKTSTPAPVLIVQFSPERLADYVKMAARLRGVGIGVEVYPEGRRIGQQLKYAEQRGFRVALIAGDEEFSKGVWKVKNLAKREEATVAESDIVTAIRAALG